MSSVLQESESDHSCYADDPVGFIENVLKETLTDDLREVCKSVVKYPVTIAQSGNGTGKSWISARLAVWFFKCRFEPQVYGAAAPPESNLRNILWSEVSAIIDNNPGIFKDCSTKDLYIQRKSREFMTGVTIPTAGTDKTKEARFSGKHAPSLFFLCDEADAIPDPVFDGIETCLSGGFDRLLCMFNPRQRLGAVYRYVKEGRANVVTLTAFSHPNVITGDDVIPGAVTRAKTVRRIAQWTRPVADGEEIDKRCFLLPGFLEGCVPVDQRGKELSALIPGWYRIIESRFYHVVLGEYPAQSDKQLISEEWLDKARSRYDLYVAQNGENPPEYIRCIAGGDVAEFGVDKSVLSMRYGNLLLPLIKHEGRTDPLQVGDLFANDLAGADLNTINIDGTGVGSGVAPYLSRKNLPAVTVKVSSASTERAYGVDEVGEFGILRDELLWKYMIWLRDEQAMIPPDPELIEESLALEYETKNGKIKVSSTDDIKKLLKRSPDSLMSVVMGFYETGMFAGLDLS